MDIDVGKLKYIVLQIFMMQSSQYKATMKIKHELNAIQCITYM